MHDVTNTDGGHFLWLANNGFANELEGLLKAVEIHLIEIKREKWSTDLIILASGKGNSTLVKILIDLKLCDKRAEGEALCKAAANGHEAVVSQLLAIQRIDVNTKLDFLTPLWRAASGGHTSVVKLLINTPYIDIKSKNGSFGQRPLAEAAEFGKVDVVELLLETNRWKSRRRMKRGVQHWAWHDTLTDGRWSGF